MAKKATFQDFSAKRKPEEQTLFRWVYDELRSAILEGRLRPGARLPSTRNLAQQFGVSRGTVVVVFEQLQAEGYIVSQTGSGTVVATALPDEFTEVSQAPSSPQNRLVSTRSLSERGACLLTNPFLIHRQTAAGKPFQSNTPAVEAFPIEVWSRLAGRRMRRATRLLLSSGDPAGYRPLREALAAYLQTARGVRCEVEQILIVSGIQQALDLTTRLLLDRGDWVWMEDPGYPGATSLFQGAGLKLCPLPVDKSGIDTTVGMRDCPPARLVYLTPAHQFPLGVMLSLERRLALLKWAQSNGSWIFEDDYDSEYRYVERPLAALQGLDQHGCVLYAGSFNKILFPALRIGYLVVPPSLVDAFTALRSTVDRFPAVMDQAILADFISDGYFGQHIRRTRELYHHRLQVFLESVSRRLGGWLEVAPTTAGLQTIGWLPQETDDQQIAQRAADFGVETIAMSRYSIQHRIRPGLILGFAAVDEKEIDRGVERLGFALQSIQSQRPSP